MRFIKYLFVLNNKKLSLLVMMQKVLSSFRLEPSGLGEHFDLKASSNLELQLIKIFIIRILLSNLRNFNKKIYH